MVGARHPRGIKKDQLKLHRVGILVIAPNKVKAFIGMITPGITCVHENSHQLWAQPRQDFVCWAFVITKPFVLRW